MDAFKEDFKEVLDKRMGEAVEKQESHLAKAARLKSSERFCLVLAEELAGLMPEYERTIRQAINKIVYEAATGNMERHIGLFTRSQIKVFLLFIKH